MHNIQEIVSKKDVITILEIIYDCNLCENPKDAFDIMQKVNTLIDFTNAVYGQARLDKYGSIVQYNTINFSYSEEWLKLYRESNFHKRDPIALENYQKYSLQYWADTFERYTVDKYFNSMSEEFGLNNGYTCGTINRSKTVGSILSLAGNIERHTRNVYILNNLSSHLDIAFSNVLRVQNKNNSLFQISIREKEVLNWVKNGKSTWDISIILSISERTVKFHIDNIMKKLDAVSRTHAVAIALAAGLIDYGETIQPFSAA